MSDFTQGNSKPIRQGATLAAASTTIFTHTNAAEAAPLFYRVGVE